MPETSPAPPAAGRRLAADLALYTLARLGLVVILAALILGVASLVGVSVPLIVALLFAILLALPLSMVLLKSLRIRVNESIAAVDERRRRDKADLRAKLRGEDSSG